MHLVGLKVGLLQLAKLEIIKHGLIWTKKYTQH